MRNFGGSCDLITEKLRYAIGKSRNMSPQFGDIRVYNEHMEYRYRLTLEDVTTLGSGLRVLEIGAFTGVVSVALAELGYQVTAHDIPFIINDPDVVAYLDAHHVGRVALDLSETYFQVPDSSFDLIVFNEVLEHLNFNALPLLREFCRMLSPGGRVYCATPNLACLKNRWFLLEGEGFLSPV